MNYKNYLLNISVSVKQALIRLNEISANAVVFITNDDGRLVGSLTDGDIRRGFINGLGFEDPLSKFIQPNPKYIQQGRYNLKDIIALREQFFWVFPVVNTKMEIIDVVNFKHQKSYLPVDALIMAGGKGERMKPLTHTTPKPLLKVGEKPIIEHNIDRLNIYGIDDIWISIGYLGDQLVDYFKDGSKKAIRINYVSEESALGTAGALGLVDNFTNDHILMMNSDLLTNIDFEEFYLFFEEHQVDFAVACIPYQLNVPYAVMEIQDHLITGFKEKPTYVYYSNAGIYLMKREVISHIPKNEPFDATDLMEVLLKNNKKLAAYPLLGYWRDIGRHEDYEKAQIDIKKIKF